MLMLVLVPLLVLVLGLGLVRMLVPAKSGVVATS